MIKIIYGEDRVRAKKEIAKVLGDEYEIIEGADMAPSDMPSVFLGGSLFCEKRNILIRDITSNKAVYEKLPEYIDSTHNIVIFEMGLDKRTTAYKAIKDKVVIKEFAMPRDLNMGMIFDIYRVAKRDGKKAIKMLNKVQESEDPVRFCGLMVSQALKDYRAHPGVKEKRALRELSKLDLDMKSTSLQPWLLVQSFLLRLSSL